jgi:hypothetical protein
VSARLTWAERWREVFSVDLRTLALFRFLLGMVFAVDMVNRFADLRAFYTDFGLMPREAAEVFAGPLRVSLHLANGEAWFAGLLLAIEGLAALALAFGWRTRLAAVIVFVLQVSLLNRNTMILLGGDTLMACLLFWGLFLPLHARWSVDAALAANEPPATTRWFSPATVGITLQALSVYFFSSLLKSSDVWWPDGTGVYYTMTLERYSSPLGRQLLQFPLLMQGLSYFVYFLEMFGPLLALSPLLQRPLRFLVMLCLMGMHTGFILFMEIGHFPYVSLTSLTLLLGGWWWDWAQRAFDHGRHVRIYYDRDCAFCLKSCQLFRTLMVLPRCEILPAQNSVRANALMEAQYSWVVIDGEDVAHTKWSAFVALVRHSLILRWLAPLASLKLWERPGVAVYDWVGRHRGAFGEMTAALLPTRPLRVDVPRWADAVAAFFAVVLLGWNFATVNWLPDSVMRVFSPVVRVLRIDQTWNMFAPRPWRDDGWYLVPGRLEDGREVDLLTGAPVDYSRPMDIAATDPNVRWRTYRTLIWDPTFAENRRFYARFLCRDWNVAAPPGGHVLTFKIVYMLERAVPPGETPTVEQRVLWWHECLGKEVPASEQQREEQDREIPPRHDKDKPV